MLRRPVPGGLDAGAVFEAEALGHPLLPRARCVRNDLSLCDGGLRVDASAAIRKLASAGWIKAAAVPDDAVPLLIETLHDPEIQVRANAAHSLSRLDALPAEAIPALVECTTEANEGLRMNAALALKSARPDAVATVMEHLLGDTSLRVRLIAASSLLIANPDHAKASPVVVEALGDSSPRVRKAALELVESLGTNGAAFIEAVKKRGDVEEEPEVRGVLSRLVDHFLPAAHAEPEQVAK